MKIVYVYDSIARIGGVERILVDKMNYLADHYHYDVYLITAAQGNHGYSFPLSPNVKHIDINVRFHLQYQYKYPKRLWVKWKMDYLFRKKLERQVNIINPDIIIGTTYYKADVICELKCRAKKIIESHCAKSHTGDLNDVTSNPIIHFMNNRKMSRYYKTIEKRSDGIVALTHGDALEWRKSNNIYIIPNTITKVDVKINTEKKQRVISVGRLSSQKRFDRLIESWVIVATRHPDWKLDIYGEGSSKNVLLKQISQIGLEHTITIHPNTQRISEEYCCSAIFALSSNYEGFGLVLAEAMACGIPCVSFNCPYGPSDIIKDKEDGLIIENGNIEQLAESICYLIENEATRKQYGEKARENAKRFFPENIMPQWANLFEQIIL